MRQFILGASLLALGAPAWGQGQDLPECADYPVAEGEECVIILAHERYTLSDAEHIVIVGTLNESSSPYTLTSPVTVLTDQIVARNQSSLPDLLRAVPSLSVSSSGPSTGLTQLRLRGAEANQIVVFIDGVEVANPADGAFDFGGLRTGSTARVEVLRGEQSALYGSDAVGGVINILTDTQEGMATRFEVGARGTVEAGLSAGVPIGEALLTLDGNAFNSNGYDISGLGERDAASSRSGRLGLTVPIGEASLSGHYGVRLRRSEFDEDSDFDGRLNDTDSATDVRTDTANVTARGNIGQIDTRISASHVQTETDTRAGFSSDTTGTRDKVQGMGSYFRGSHTVTVLGEWERERYAFEADPDTPSNDSIGVAGEYLYSGGRIDATLSARHDFNDLFDDATTWRVGAGYSFDWDGRATASVGVGVKNPTLIELFGFFPASRFTGNPDLQPERSLGYNLGYTQYLGDLELGINYFRSELESEIVTLFNPDFTTSLANLEADSTREGLELEATLKVGDLSLFSSASFLDADQNGTPEIRRPEFLASATVSWRATDDLTLSAFLDHNGSQLDTDFATFSNVELDAFTLLGGNVNYNVTDSLSIYARGENLLDEDYEEVVGYRSPGAALFVGLRADY